jgi:hypothetical protein
MGCEESSSHLKCCTSELFPVTSWVRDASMLLKDHNRSSTNHLGSCWVTFTFLPWAARLTLTPSHQNLRLHTLVSDHHLILFSSLTYQRKALVKICSMAPLPHCTSLLRQTASSCQYFRYDTFFCFVMHTPADSDIAAPNSFFRSNRSPRIYMHCIITMFETLPVTGVLCKHKKSLQIRYVKFTVYSKIYTFT